jgi:integrase
MMARTDATEWITRWRDELRETAYPGVWKRRAGGYRVRLRATDKRTGKRLELNRCYEARTAKQALKAGQGDLEDLQRKGSPTAVPRFGEWAATLFERKVATGEIKSAAGRTKWRNVLNKHLIDEFGDVYLDQLRRADVEAYRVKLGKRIQARKLKPETANTRLKVLFTIVRAAVAEFDLDRDPVRGVKTLDTSTHVTYPEEAPNALTPEELPVFLATVRELYPHHYAMTALGFATGLRPSSLRPLRRCGDSPDVLWSEGALLVRRSHTEGDEVMETTKTGTRQKIALPPELIAVLRWHADTQIPEAIAAETDLLFPGRRGGLTSARVLEHPFTSVSAALGVSISPRAMRRTFQDLTRSERIADVVTRSISGHATEAMQRHYSTVRADEQRAAIAKVIQMFPAVGG